MKKYFILFSICAIILSSFSCSSEPSFPDDQTKKMDDLVTMVINTYKVPGIIAAVWVPDKGTWVKSFGYANTTTSEKMDTDMLFRIASVTKTFTAHVILKLVDERKLSLDDTLGKYITDFYVPNANIITIRQLGAMTSGLFDYTEDDTFNSAHAADPLRVWTPKELVEIASTHSVYFDPGTSYHYSNTNFILLGMIIEKITGNNLQTEIQNKIIIPFGLSHTTFATSSETPSNLSHGYALGEDGVTISDVTAIDASCAWAAGSIISNIDDLKIWAKAVGEGTGLTAASHAVQTTWTDEPGITLPFKYGFGTMAAGNFFGHEGSIDGYYISMMYLPTNGAIFVVMVNLNPNDGGNLADGVFAQLAKIVLPDDVSW